jgi:hypothetical protein
VTPQECTRRLETILSRKDRLAQAPTDRARKVRAKALRRAKRKHVESMAEFLGVGEPMQILRSDLISEDSGAVRLRINGRLVFSCMSIFYRLVAA